MVLEDQMVFGQGEPTLLLLQLFTPLTSNVVLQSY